MENVPQNNQYTSQFTEEESGFDIKEWLMFFLHYWYLFVIFISFGLGTAYFINRSWIESSQVTATLIIEEASRYSGSQTLMQGFGVQSGYRNLDNQKYLLQSYDFIGRVVDSMPSLNIDYISKGRFIVRNRYGDAPFQIQAEYVSPQAYGILFKIEIEPNGQFVITDENKLSIKMKGRFNEPFQNNLLFATIVPIQQNAEPYAFYFRFRDRESLIADFLPRLNVSYPADASSVLSISLVSETPMRDMDFINKLSEVYISENLQRKNDAANKTMKFIDEQLSDVKKSLETSEGAMTEFRKSNQIIDMSSHSSEILSKATGFDTKQQELKLKENYFNYLSNYLKSNLESGSIIVPSSVGINEPMLVNLVQQFNEALLLRNEKTEKDPYYPKYTRDLENSKAAIVELVKNMRSALNLEKVELNKNLSAVKQQVTTLPQKEMEMVALERKYKVDDNYYTFFLQKRAEAAIQKASNSPDNTVLDKARIMGVTNGDVKSKTYMKYGLIGLLIPLILLILMKLLNNTVKSTKDIEKNSPFPIIGSVRHTRSTDPMLAAHRPRSSFTEMFRVIRTRLEFIVQRKSKVAILITSTESGDGKTYFCTNLASVYGMSGMKTILVDMDIRKPSVAERLSLTEREGVTNYLIGEKALESLIVKKEKMNFDVLLGGTVPPNPGELIRSDKLKEMFALLREMYDYIIVDTSPIGLVADAYALAPMMDANLFVVRSEKTNKSFYKKLNEQLKADKINHVYNILNDVNTENTAYGKYSSYGYGYGAGYGYYGKSKKKEYDKNTHYYEDDENI